MRIFFSESDQADYFFVNHIIFAVAVPLHAVTLLCLLKETPPFQSDIKKYLLFIQALLFVFDCYLLLLQPVFLFPALCSYCVGPICSPSLDLPPNVILSITWVLVSSLGASAVICCFYRQQAIAPASSRFKINQRCIPIINLAMVALFTAEPISFMLIPYDRANAEHLISTSEYDLSWVRQRGAYVMMDREMILTSVLCITGVIIVSGSSLFVALFAHMLYVLQTETSKSPEVLRKIRRSVYRMIAQFIIPLVFLSFPMFEIFVASLCGCFSAEQTRVSVSMLGVHSILHNSILLAITPAYRKFIFSIHQLGRRKKSSVRTVQSSLQ